MPRKAPSAEKTVASKKTVGYVLLAAAGIGAVYLLLRSGMLAGPTEEGQGIGGVVPTGQYETGGQTETGGYVFPAEAAVTFPSVPYFNPMDFFKMPAAGKTKKETAAALPPGSGFGDPVTGAGVNVVLWDIATGRPAGKSIPLGPTGYTLPAGGIPKAGQYEVSGKPVYPLVSTAVDLLSVLAPAFGPAGVAFSGIATVAKPVVAVLSGSSQISKKDVTAAATSAAAGTAAVSIVGAGAVPVQPQPSAGGSGGGTGWNRAAAQAAGLTAPSYSLPTKKASEFVSAGPALPGIGMTYIGKVGG